jgi:hypothetical protein
MDPIYGLGIAGSVASIVALFLPADRWRNRVIHASYVFVIVIVAGMFARDRAELERIRDLRQAAERFVADREQHYTHAGFVQAGLGFLELHRATFPDAYTRGKQLCERQDCWGNGAPDIVSIAFAMNGLLRGGATTAIK